MTIDVLVHNMGVKGISPPVADVTFEINYDTQLQTVFDWVNGAAAENGGINRFLIVAHGKTWPTELTNGVERGGTGIEFARHGIVLSTVDQFRALRPSKIRRVLLFVCNAADYVPALCKPREVGDGPYLMTKLAVAIQAPVVASTAKQRYTPHAAGHGIDFGRWEGDVFEFFPNGTRRVLQRASAMKASTAPGQWPGDSFQQPATPPQSPGWWSMETDSPRAPDPLGPVAPDPSAAPDNSNPAPQ